ncbi:hypothetical protein JHL17_07690 [Azospirillum sp. YIM B02556]|uniref:Uncharacterized protein n=1 Tax=Azospirillum endophyticum TaxID=2800326 RepID=A0ABS1F1L0_9PROT|nr:hypothetical protein [Azospirillum endophyticum]MBK1837292.1 hypothetical protein [Azospirillum endophyticum]
MTQLGREPQSAERLFRREALERLSTTEDFDQPPTLANPCGLRLQLALAALCILAAVGVLALVGA